MNSVYSMNAELSLIQTFSINDVWLRNNYSNLQKKYRNEYVAIKGGNILDHDKDAKNLIKRLGEKGEDLITILIEFIPEKGLSILY